MDDVTRKGIGIYLICLGVAIFFVFILSFLWAPIDGYSHEGTMVLTSEQRSELVGILGRDDTSMISISTVELEGSSWVSFEFTTPYKKSFFGEEVKEVENCDYMFFSLTSVLLLIPGVILLSDKKEA